MIRIFLIILGVAAVGFSAGVASVISGKEAQAQIYLRKGDNATKNDDGASAPPRRSVYLRQGRQDSRARNQNATRYREALRERRILNNDLAALKYWTESGRKPRTIEEIRSYSRALRTPNRLAMLNARAEITPMLAAQRQQHLAAYQARIAANTSNSKVAASAYQVPQQDVEIREESKVRRVPRNAVPRSKIYRSYSDTPEPVRVFKNYR